MIKNVLSDSQNLYHQNGSPFFSLLHKEARIEVYKQLVLPPAHGSKECAGLILSCKLARDEVNAEALSVLKQLFKKIEERVNGKMGSKLRIALRGERKGSVLDPRSVIIRIPVDFSEWMSLNEWDHLQFFLDEIALPLLDLPFREVSFHLEFNPRLGFRFLHIANNFMKFLEQHIYAPFIIHEGERGDVDSRHLVLLAPIRTRRIVMLWGDQPIRGNGFGKSLQFKRHQHLGIVLPQLPKSVLSKNSGGSYVWPRLESEWKEDGTACHFPLYSETQWTLFRDMENVPSVDGDVGWRASAERSHRAKWCRSIRRILHLQMP